MDYDSERNTDLTTDMDLTTKSNTDKQNDALLRTLCENNPRFVEYLSYCEAVSQRRNPSNLALFHIDKPAQNEAAFELCQRFLIYIDDMANQLIATEDYNTATQVLVSNLLFNCHSIFTEPFDALGLINNVEFAKFLNVNQIHFVECLKAFNITMLVNDGFNEVTNLKKRKRDVKSNVEIPLSNSYSALSESEEESDEMIISSENPNENESIKTSEIDPSKGKTKSSKKLNKVTKTGADAELPPLPPSQTDDASPDGSVVAKNKIHPFLCEVQGNWSILAKEVIGVNKTKPLIKMDGVHLKIQCRSLDDFRATQNYLDEKLVKYTTLTPQERRPRKVCIRGIPVNSDPKMLISALAELGFQANRAAMLKNRKTGQPMPIYLFNIIPNDKFEEIFNIDELCNVSVTVERFRGAGIIKQCYSCQLFGHASEVCGFTPRCVKCAQNHLSTECPHKERITPTCANCHGMHPASYRGCPKNPANLRKPQTKPKNNNGLIPSNAVDLLSHLNYTKNQNTEQIINENASTSKTTPPPPPPRYVPVKQHVNQTASESGNKMPTRNIINTSIKVNKNKTPSSEISENITSNCTQDLNEIFGAFQEVKEMLNLNKFISFFKKIAELTRSCKTPFQKLIVLIDNLEHLISDLNLHYGE